MRDNIYHRLLLISLVAVLLAALGWYTFVSAGQRNGPVSYPQLQQRLQHHSGQLDIVDHQSHLIALCDNVQQASRSGLVDANLTAMQATLVARVLIEWQRNSAATTNASSVLTHYQQYCLPDLALTPHLSPAIEGESIAEAQARYLLDFATDYWQATQNQHWLSFAYGVRWLQYNLQDKHALAVEVADLAIEAHPTTGDPLALSEKYSYLGTSLVQLGKLNEALQSMRVGLAIVLDNQLESKFVDAYFGVAFAYLKIGDYDTARHYFHRILALENHRETEDAEACPDYSLKATKALVQLGIIDRLTSKPQAALQKHRCAGRLLADTQDYYRPLTLLEQAKDEAAAGQWQAAERSLKRLAGDHLLDAHLIQSRLLQMQLNEAAGAPVWDEALLTFLQDRLAPTQAGYPLVIEFIELTRLKMIHAARLDDKSEFLNQARLGLQAIEQVKAGLEQSDAWQSARHAFVNDYVMGLVDSQQFSDKQKLSTILQVLDGHYSLSFLADHTDRMEEGPVSSAKARLMQRTLDAEKALLAAKPGQRSTLKQALAESKDHYRAKHPELPPAVKTPSREQPQGDLLQRVQQQLAPDEMVIRYFVHEQRSLALAITRDAVQLHRFGQTAQIRELLDSLPDLQATRQLTAAMSSPVLSHVLPLSAMLDGQIKRLTVIPDDMLHRLPFSALDINPDKRRYRPLGADIAVVRTYSLQEYLLESVPRQSALAAGSAAVSVFADPWFESLDEGQLLSANQTTRGWQDQLVRLPETAREARQIAQLFGDDKVTVYTGKSVTNQNLMAQPVRQSRLVHIATHGYYDPDVPDVVGIATSPDKGDDSGFLSLTELLSKPFYSDLVVISGCETMLGRHLRGSGMNSFTRGFLSNGAGSVIGTLWKVPDGSTADFMKAFYLGLSENGGDTADALFRAKQALWQNPDYRDPYYWAGFVLTSVNRQYQQLHLE